MSFALTPTQRAYVERVRALAQTDLSGGPQGDSDRVDRELLGTLGRLGLLRGLFGGEPDEPPRDAAAMQLCLLRETIATVNTHAETALALQGLGSYPILQAGAPAAVERWMPGVVSGDVAAGFALSEAGAGSDAAALALRAEPDGEGWRLSGEKTWISNAPDADVYTVFARTTPDTRARGVTAFVVAGDAEGLAGEPIDLLSPHPIGRLTFDGVRVERSDVLGEVDKGFAVAMRTLDLFRPSVGAFAVGMAQAALDAALAYANERQVHGAPLIEQQSVAHTLAEMATRLQASRLLVYAAASAYDDGADARHITTSAAMAKLHATEAAQYVVDQAVQLHGARALQRGHLLEQLYRDVRAPRIYEGASEVQRTIVARGLGKG
ncbi:acyl-CoA dehydrogenase family protein [Solicola gregarius]|uniref:Acyl-CoA dehydrogenase family protein n=1 Tax=Solicola gregarius TaxID=2908642 RepID=A0AA46TJL3_9ACTN|nr:acyl-CoA dehydrogenase family protein [Solicola gregarius]UYM06511.1 acyl-CoA dehydrogenase family protein [Solicola gregarius]